MAKERTLSEISDIIREDQRRLDRMVADLKNQTLINSTSAAKFQDIFKIQENAKHQMAKRGKKGT